MNTGPLRIATRTVRNLNRYRQIMTVLVRHGFADFVDRLRVTEYLDFARHLMGSAGAPPPKHTTAERLRLALQELGPTFIKLGQMLSTRPDLVPAEFVEEFARLREHVPPFPFEQVRQIVERELGHPLEQLFEQFDPQCLAAASIGQVHWARLRDGQNVVVKVQRPDIRGVIEADVEILQHLAALVEHRFPEWAVQQPGRVVAEFGRVIEHELDYKREAEHLQRFAGQFAGDATVRLPRCYPEFSTSTVLTLEYMPVTPIGDLDHLRHTDLDPRLIARRGAELTLKQIFVHGFFHADPHPGNVFVLPGNVICLLDFGMVGRLTTRMRYAFSELVYSIAQRDSDRTARSLLRFTEHDDDDEAQLDLQRLELDVAEFIDRHVVHALERLDFGRLLQELLTLVNRHRLRVPTDAVTMLKAAATVEQIARRLDPKLDMVQLARPFVRRVLKERYSARRTLRAVREAAGEMLELARDVPAGSRDLLRQLKLGRLKLGFEHRGLQPMLATNERIANRLAFAIVVAALIVGSSLIVLSKLPPTWYGVPLIGIGGYLAAGVMGFILLVAMVRHGRL